jgi:hypothetical protein
MAERRSSTVTWIQNRRILLVAPAFHPWDLGSYVAKILARKGAHVETFAYGQSADRPSVQTALLAACRRVRPHLLFGLKLDAIDALTLRHIRSMGATVSLWYVDCFSTEPPEWIRPLFQECDVFFTSAKGLLPKYASIAQTPAYWIVEGAYLPAFRTVRLNRADRRLFGSQVAFIGSVYHGSGLQHVQRRARLFRRLGRDYLLTVWGRQQYPATALTADKRCRVVEWPAYNSDVVRICQSSDIVLGINLINSIELYFSNRTFLTLAAGGFHLTHYVPKLETMFENHRHLVWYHSTRECVELAGFYASRPRLRRAIASAGHAWVRSRYSMTTQVNTMLERIQHHA